MDVFTFTNGENSKSSLFFPFLQKKTIYETTEFSETIRK